MKKSLSYKDLPDFICLISWENLNQRTLEIWLWVLRMDLEDLKSNSHLIKLILWLCRLSIFTKIWIKRLTIILWDLRNGMDIISQNWPKSFKMVLLMSKLYKDLVWDKTIKLLNWLILLEKNLKLKSRLELKFLWVLMLLMKTWVSFKVLFIKLLSYLITERN